MRFCAPYLPHDTEPPTDRRGSAAFASGEYPAADAVDDDEVVYMLGGERIRAHVGLRSLCERLIDDGHVSRAEMAATTALARADGTNVVDKLLSLGLIEPDALARAVREHGREDLQRHDNARIPLRRTAEVESVNGRTVMTTLDISDAGVRLRGASLLPITSRVVVRLSIAGERLELEGRVAGIERTTESEAPALVVLWTDVPEATDEAFARILEALY